MSLKDWLQSGWLVVHRSSKQEIGQLFGVADRDLRDCHSVFSRSVRYCVPAIRSF
jgi:hypothetical protein